MKELLKNRKVAIGITVVVMVLSTLLGAHRSLLAAAYPVEQYFIEGEDGYSIQRDLDTRAGLASNLLVVAGRYLPADDGARLELEDAITALTAADSIREKSTANQQLTAATERVYLVLEEYSLSSSDERYRKQIRTDLASCNQTISHNAYNEMATQYNKNVLGKFPANVLSRVAMVSELDTFQ
jgi:hypothetical protein